MWQLKLLVRQNYTNFLLQSIDCIYLNCIYAGIPGLIEIPGTWTRPELTLARNKNSWDASSIVNTSRFIDHRAFDFSKIDFLLKSS